MGFGGAGVFVEAHLVAVCCKRAPRRARRGAERALWDMVGARVVGKRAADTPFFGNHPRVESQQQATEGKGGDVRGATCHNSGMQAHRHGEERGDAELIVYARGSEIKGARRTDPLSMNPLCIVILSRNSFRSSLAVPHSTTVAPTLFTPTVLTPTLFTPPTNCHNDLHQHRRRPPLRRARRQHRRCQYLHHQPCRRHHCYRRTGY